ncbi:MAG: high frequency lysogenization protein, partial [Pseudomonadota bacterium]
QFPEAELAEKPEAIRELSRLYQGTLSTLPFRIQVRGDMNHLKNEHTACRIRALLFAGVRAAVLWRQVGGKRWHLLLQRKRIARDVTRLLHKLPG